MDERSTTYIVELGARRWVLIHAFQHYIKTTYTDTMAEKAKVEPDAAPSTDSGTGGSMKWCQTQQNLRAVFLTRPS